MCRQQLQLPAMLGHAQFTVCASRVVPAGRLATACPNCRPPSLLRRYFLHNWPHLCFLASAPGGHCFACVVAKQDVHRGRALRGYVAMLTVEARYRYLGVGAWP